MVSIKKEMFEILKNNPHKKYDAWDMYEIFDKDPKTMQRYLLLLQKRYENIWFERSINGMKFYYKNERAEEK